MSMQGDGQKQYNTMSSSSEGIWIPKNFICICEYQGGPQLCQPVLILCFTILGQNKQGRLPHHCVLLLYHITFSSLEQASTSCRSLQHCEIRANRRFLALLFRKLKQCWFFRNYLHARSSCTMLFIMIDSKAIAYDGL